MSGRNVLAGGLAVALLLVAPAGAGAQCDPTTECCAGECSGDTGLPSAADCEADACGCASQINCFILERETDWNLYPNSVEFEPTVRPVHGRYLTILVDPTAEAGLARYQAGTPGPVEMAPGTVIVKKNFPPDASEPGVPSLDPNITSITSMINLDGYCPDVAGATDQCVGGDWYFLLRVGDSFPLFGKPSGCTNCHAAAVNADWLWRLFSSRRYQER